MSHDTLTIGGVAIPGGGTVSVIDTSPGGVVPRVQLRRKDVHPDAGFDPDAAGGLADLLLTWAVGHGYMPRPSVQWDRWSLPDPDVFAVLIERALIGEVPTVENYERYASAYREACRIAAALPEVLALLEQYQAAWVLDAEVVGCGRECSEMHTFAPPCELAEPLARHQQEFATAVAEDRPDLLARPSEVPFCAGPSDNAHPRRAMSRRPAFVDPSGGWWCPTCGETWPDEDRDPAQADDMPELLQRLVDAWGALGVARKLRDGVPEADRAAWLRSLARPDGEHVLGDLPSDWTPTPGPVFPKVADLRLILEHLTTVVIDAPPGSVLAEAYDRLREAVDAAEAIAAGVVAMDRHQQVVHRLTETIRVRMPAEVVTTRMVRCDVLGDGDLQVGRSIALEQVSEDEADLVLLLGRAVPVDPLGRDGDPVEDEDGAPLPDSVQFLLTCARRVVQTSERGTAALAAHIADLARALEQVESESRR